MADSDNPVGRSRAHARGRARGQKPPEPARRPTDVIAITTPASQFPAVVRPPVAQPPQPAGAGRALHRGVTSEARSDGAAAATSSFQAITTGMEAVTVGQPGGRGAMRGRPPAKDEVHCRPPSCLDKRGTQGSPIDLLTNYVKVTSAFGSDFIFYQYRVDFSPSIESSKMLRAMLFDHLDTIGRSFVFDGMEDLKTTTRLEKDEMILWSKRRTDDENIQITVKHTGELNGRHPEVLRLTNTQQRKNFLHMGFVAMGRNMFDKEAALPVVQYKIELWPGVLTAIRMYENSLLMVVDVIHKVVRMDTVLQQLRQHYARDKNNYLQNCSKELAGCIVMTSYNNKTYSLDDFDSTKCPTDTFETRKTALISYVEDYKKQYDITIRDLQQPLIICRPKERDFRSGAKDPVYLIPELCVMTGLIDNMRSDFNLMREVAKTTRPGPRSRVEMLKSFMNRCLTNAKVKEDMEKWGISYRSEPLQLKGRVVPQEKIIQGRSEFTAKDGDFGKDMRSKPMHNPRHMDKFAMISTQRDRPNCEELYETFKRVCGPLKMNVAAPKIILRLDMLRYKAEKVDQCEHVIENLKIKLSDFQYVKKQLKKSEIENSTYFQRNLKLQEKNAELENKVRMSKLKLEELNMRLFEETQKALKFQLEAKCFSEKLELAKQKVIDEVNLEFEEPANTSVGADSLEELDILEETILELPQKKTNLKQKRRSEFTAKDGDFGKDMRSKPMHNPRHMDKFAMISTQRDRPNCEELYETFKRVCGPMKMNVAAPKIMSVSDDRTTSFLNAIKDAIKMGATLIVAIVPNNKADRYDAIKKLCCIECPVPSQVVVSRTLSKKQMLMSVATKIAIQINCKLGGEAWALTIPLKQRTMILGIDTYHDSSVKGRSVGGLVASMNELFTCWASRVAFHNNREELSSQLRANFVILLKKYHGINKDTPDLIIVYRDGLSDGELEYAKEYEVKQLLAAYADVTGGNKVPRFAFVVVNKRISTRFFTNGRGQYDNPPPGTIVDTEVTKPERYDFYLISQSIRQGTVSPTLFNVIEDTTGLKPDHMQRIAYKLTHMYVNWQGTIRVPAPCQYAHKLAFLVGQSLHREPADILCNQLFFL